MRNQETGEFELVVGNRQLLSGFFIIVLLFAVAFAMGYVMGQNSPRSAKPDDTAAAPAVSGEPQPQSTPIPPPMNSAPAAQQPVDTPAPADASPQPTTQPVREEPSPATAQPAAPPAQAAAQPPAETTGSYWQVGSWKQEANAQALYQTLKDGGMPARLQSGADGLVHVMVGPYRDARSLREARDLLQTKFGVKDLYRK